MVDSEKAARLRKARKSAGYVSASEAARSLGVSTATYIHHENGTRDFGEGPAAIYARRYHVKQSWLLLGDGDMRDEQLTAEQHAEAAERDEEERERRKYQESLGSAERYRLRNEDARRDNEATLKITKDLAFIPEVLPDFTREFSVSSRSWLRYADLEDPVFHPVSATWGFPKSHLQHELGARPETTILFQIIGNANAPSLVHGDLAIVDTGTSDVIADSFYLVADKVAHPQVRFLSINLFSEPTTVTMFAEASPENKMVLQLDAISIVGKVVGKIGRM